MSNAIKNSIKFRLRYQVHWGRALYIVIECKQTLYFPLRMECIEMIDHVWESDIIEFSQAQPGDEVINYWFYSADFDDYQLDCQDVKWDDGSHEKMIRSFTRNLCKDKFVIKLDQCDQRKYSIDHQGNRNYEIKQNIEIKNMRRTVRLSLSLIKGLPQGRWIFAMPLPDNLPADSDEFQEKDFLKAERMQRYKTKNPEKSIWKMDWIYTMEEIQKMGGSTNIAFYQSYYYKRMIKYWQAILPNGQKKSLEQVASMLNSSGTPYEIQIIDQSNGQKIYQKSNNMQDYIKQKFVYEIEKGINPLEVSHVFLISETFGKQRMARREDNPRFWQATIMIPESQVQSITYYAQIYLIGKVSNQIKVTKQWSLRNVYQPGKAMFIHETGNICNTTSYTRYQYGSVGNRRGSWSSESPGSRHQRSNYYNVIYNNYAPTWARCLGSPRTETNWRNYNNYYSIHSNFYYSPSSNTTQIIYTPPAQIYPSHIFKNYSSSSSSSTNLHNIYNFSSQNQRPHWYSYYNTAITTSRSSQISQSASVSPVSSSKVMSQNQTQPSSSSSSVKSFNSFSFVGNDGQHSIDRNKNSNFVKSTQRLIQKSRTSTHTKSQSSHKVQKVVNKIASMPESISNYQNLATSIFNMNEQDMQYIKVSSQLNPVKLKLIKKTQIQQISDNFQQQKQKILQIHPELSPILNQLKQLRQQQNKSETKIVNQNMKIFSIQIIAAAKRWGKNKYVVDGEVNIMNIVYRYFPKLKLQLEEKEKEKLGNGGVDGNLSNLIFSIVYYINQSALSQKYYQSATHYTAPFLTGGNCQNGFIKTLAQKFQALQNKYTLLTFQQIKDHLLYRSLIQCIKQPLDQIKKFGQINGVTLNYDNRAEKLMRILIQYSCIYSLGRCFLDNAIFTPFGTGCGQFDPFCQQAGEFTTTLLLQSLQSIRDKYIQSNTNQQQKLTSNTQKMQTLQQTLCQKIQQTIGKQALQIINISFDLQQLNKQFASTGSSEILVQAVIDLEKGAREYEEELEAIDGIEMPKQRIVRIRRLKEHEYVKTVMSVGK